MCLIELSLYLLNTIVIIYNNFINVYLIVHFYYLYIILY